MKKLLEINDSKNVNMFGKKSIDTSDDEHICRKCKSNKLDYSKLIGYGEILGKVYHYKAHCLSCGTKYNVERTNYVYDKVKNKPWNESKSFIKYKSNNK